jgi:hypothetical protein
MKQNGEIEPFAKFIEALDPWLGEVVLVGGWAHRLFWRCCHSPRTDGSRIDSSGAPAKSWFQRRICCRSSDSAFAGLRYDGLADRGT